MAKDFYISDENFNATAYSVEEALLKQVTRWKGWRCSAGTENIHITADGNIYGATCKVGGLLGNVYDTGSGLPPNWIECTKSVCACGSDMLLRKAKDKESIKLLDNLKPEHLKYDSALGNPTLIGPIFQNEYKLNCTWDLGRRCNFSCDYCNSSISNNFESHRSWGSLNHAYQEIKRMFCKGQPTKFVFTGGEPTINPNYMTLVKAIHADGHLMHTQTNGSLTHDYYAELIRYSFIGISVHLKFYNHDKLLRNIQAIMDVRNSDENLSFRWFGIRIMAPPERVDEAILLYEELKEKFKFDGPSDNITLSPVYTKNKEEELQLYSPDDMARMQKCF